MIDVESIGKALREDTVLVSVMHVNNETGSIQPIEAICNLLNDHNAYLHVDAAQSFGKLSDELDNSRIDFISASGHKLYAPKGVGALVTRKRGFLKAPLKPVYFGGGQEKGLRPGTLPVQLIAGFGLACELAQKNKVDWQNHSTKIKEKFLALISRLGGKVIGQNTSPFVTNFYIPGVNSEAAMFMLKDVIAVSNGSACTSSSYQPSHVLTNMGLTKDEIEGSIRISWSHMTDDIPIDLIEERLKNLI